MIKIAITAPDDYRADLAIYFVQGEKDGPPRSPCPAAQLLVDRAFVLGDFSGDEHQTILHYPQVAELADRILLVGLGKEALSRETLREAGGVALGAALKTSARRVLLVPPTPRTSSEPSASEVAECLIEGALLATYRFDLHKTSKDEKDKLALEEVALAASSSAVIAGAKRGEVAAAAACLARDLANEPANYLTPAALAVRAESLAAEHRLGVRVLSPADLKRQHLGGILAVSAGSSAAPQMIILEYRAGRKRRAPLLLVGKGLTFDAGGISLKPAKGMEEMKYDVSGGAVALGVMSAVARERPAAIDVVAIIPATENLPGPSAIKPGDVITQYNGKTVEVVNTDAEGRLILADALAYGVKKFKPHSVVDVATLTGSVVVGLGHHRTGLFSNNDQLATRLMTAGERSGEPLWRLPLGPEYRKQLKSEVADLKNVGGREGGSITAATFLQEFVGDIPWAHLDIAGTAYNFTEKSYVPKGPSGVGVRMLLEYIRGVS